MAHPSNPVLNYSLVALFFIMCAVAASSAAYQNVKEGEDAGTISSTGPNFQNIRNMNAVLYGCAAGIAGMAALTALWATWLNMGSMSSVGGGILNDPDL